VKETESRKKKPLQESERLSKTNTTKNTNKKTNRKEKSKKTLKPPKNTKKKNFMTETPQIKNPALYNETAPQPEKYQTHLYKPELTKKQNTPKKPKNPSTYN
jgi:hypothetical protein